VHFGDKLGKLNMALAVSETTRLQKEKTCDACYTEQEKGNVQWLGSIFSKEILFITIEIYTLLLCAIKNYSFSCHWFIIFFSYLPLPSLVYLPHAHAVEICGCLVSHALGVYTCRAVHAQRVAAGFRHGVRGEAHVPR
jgi:hypothetical protein